MNKEEIKRYLSGRYTEIMNFWGDKNIYDDEWIFVIESKKTGERGLIHEGDSQVKIDNKLSIVLFNGK